MTTTKNKGDYASTVYSPHDTAMAGLTGSQKAAEQSAAGISLDIPGTDIVDYFAPLLPWEICAVQAQTSNGKTYFSDWWIRQVAKQFTEEKRTQIIVKVSLEESIEAMAFDEYSRIMKVKPSDLATGRFTDWARMKMAMTVIDQTQVWRIADSSQREHDAPDLHLTNIQRCIQLLIDGEITGDKYEIGLLVIDYLQALPIDPEIKKASYESQRRLQVASDVFRLRSMTSRLNTPIIVNLQAKQKLEGNNPPLMIPGTYDGMETSAIATRFDRIISLWMPKTTHIVGQQLDLPFGMYSVSDNGAFLKVNKQRGGLPAGKIWDLGIDYEEREYMDRFYKTIAQKQKERDDDYDRAIQPYD